MSSLNEDLRDFMARNALSQSRVAQQLGIAPATLSQWLDGKYPGNVSKINDTVKSFLMVQHEKAALSKIESRFVLTSVAQEINAQLRLATTECEMCICTGAPGTGKTEALLQYAAQNPSAIYLKANIAFTAKILISKLHKLLGCGDGRGLFEQMLDDCIGKLRGSERLLIVDEAENLPYKAHEALRTIHDDAKIGVMLAGTPRLLTNFRGELGQYSQLYSRIGSYNAVREISLDDARMIITEYIPNANGNCELIYEKSKHNCRSMIKLIRRAIRLSEKRAKPIDSGIIQKASEMLVV